LFGGPRILYPASCLAKKKADVVEHPQALDHVGLIVKGRPASAGFTFKRSGNVSYYVADAFDLPLTEQRVKWMSLEALTRCDA